MPITALQRALLSRHNANYTHGLSSSEASQRRNNNDSSTTSGLNTVQAPLNCPKWICCLLPCINHIPSIKLFKQIQPDDAEVLRDGRWIRYDHASLVTGDILRLVEGDVVPADCVLISLGMEHVDVSQDINDDESESNGLSNGDNSDGSIPLEIVVDSHSITGELKPRHVTSNPSTCTDQLTTLYYGSRILEGACIALVTSTGSNVVLAQLIRDKKWPPQGDLSDELLEMEARDRADDEDVEAGIALLPR